MTGYFVLEYQLLMLNLALSAEINWADNDDELSKYLTLETVVDRGNNADYDIEVPVADVVEIPNAKLAYELYFSNSNMQPILEKWHAKNSHYYNSLINHLMSTARHFRQHSIKRIAGNMHLGIHVDMNTVLQDEKFLQAGFYANSISLKCYSADCDAEFVEMPNLLFVDVRPTDDDSVPVCAQNCTQAVRCGRGILLKTASGLSFFEIDRRIVSSIPLETANQTNIFGGETLAYVIDDENVRVMNDSKKFIEIYPREFLSTKIYACYEIDGSSYSLSFFESRGRKTFSFGKLKSRWRNDYGRVVEAGVSFWEGELGSVWATNNNDNSISFNTNSDKHNYWDNRTSKITQSIRNFFDGQTLLVSNQFIVFAANGECIINRRQGTSFETTTQLAKIAGNYTIASCSYTDVMVSDGHVIKRFDSITNQVTDIIAGKGNTSNVINIVCIEGDFYIIREIGIFKYIYD